MCTAMRILVTGGAGFIGSAVIRRLIAKTDHSVLNLDSLTYAASLEFISEVSGSQRYQFCQCDIGDAARVEGIFRNFRPGAVLHLAAETHVDRSIDAPEAFLQTNVVGTFRLLEVTRSYYSALEPGAKDQFRFLHVSTDEVFGALAPDDPPFSEASGYNPRSPYAASKAASDHMVRAWAHTFGLPILVTNCSNNYGPYQFPEKLIPLTIIKALEGQALPVYGQGQNIRDWLHVDDHAQALLAVLERGSIGGTYFVGAGAEQTNLEVVMAIAAIVDELVGPLSSGLPRADRIEFVADRPGHDFRYALDALKIRAELGWQPRHVFGTSLRETIVWYIEHEAWWRPLLQRYGGERLGVGGKRRRR